MASSVAAAWRSSTLARPWGELDPGRHGGAQPRPAAAPSLAVGGGAGHGELGPGGLGELDLGADMGELDPGAMGELNPGGLGNSDGADERLQRRRRGQAAARTSDDSGGGTAQKMGRGERESYFWVANTIGPKMGL